MVCPSLGIKLFAQLLVDVTGFVDLGLVVRYDLHDIRSVGVEEIPNLLEFVLQVL